MRKGKTWSVDCSFQSLSRKEGQEGGKTKEGEMKFFNGKYFKINRYYVFQKGNEEPVDRRRRRKLVTRSPGDGDQDWSQ